MLVTRPARSPGYITRSQHLQATRLGLGSLIRIPLATGADVERRLAAILAADVVGYSRLMEQDEAGTLAALRDRRKSILAPLVALHKGRIVKLMGDGVLVEFASAVNAVQCAVALQQKMAEANIGLEDNRAIVLRIGINLGDVAVEGEDLYGDGVNIAARLEGIAEPGTICLSGTIYEQVKGKLKLDYRDLGPQRLKNIAEPVQAYGIRSDGTALKESSPSAGTLHLTAKPSIAVLPFDNLSGSPDQQYFSDGISEDLITELSRFRSLFVIARNSSFQYRGRAVDVKRVGRELGVQYALEGSVQKAGARVRITAQCIDASIGRHLWADRYDRDLKDVFAVQDEVVQAIVSTIATRLEREELELARRRPPQDIRAYDLCLRGQKCLDRWTPDGNAEAQHLFLKALEIDPSYARAHAGLSASCEWSNWYSAWPLVNGLGPEDALHHARRAVELDDTDAQPHVTLSWIHHMRREYEQSQRHLKRALALNPHDADCLANCAMIMIAQGEPEQGIIHAEAAIRLNPNHPDWYLGFLAAGKFFVGNFNEAIKYREMMTNALPEGRAVLAAAYAMAGKIDRANELMTEFLNDFARHWKEQPSARLISNLFAFVRREDADLLVEGLRKAGMPE